MKRKRLSRGERRRLQGDTGAVAENIAAGEYERLSAFQDAGPFDLASEAGSIAEVKSALSQLSSVNAGRFRLFKNQHDRLVQYDRSESAAYAFVLMEPEKSRARLVKKNPADVGRMVGARGGWGPSGHASQGKQRKLPIEALFG